MRARSCSERGAGRQWYGRKCGCQEIDFFGVVCLNNCEVTSRIPVSGLEIHPATKEQVTVDDAWRTGSTVRGPQ